MSQLPSGPAVFRASRNHLNKQLSGAHRLWGSNAYATTGKAATVTMSDGRQLIDVATWATSILGHCYDDVVDAVSDQLTALPAAPRGLAVAPAPLLAARLVELSSPSRLSKVWFGANGADVVEAALKYARLTTGHLRVLCSPGGFHGRTAGALSVSAGDPYREPLLPLLSGSTTLTEDPEAVSRETARGDVAAVIVEIVRGGGVAKPLPSNLLRAWRESARAAGVMFIVDEVQTGLWRCGSFSLAVESGLDPDAVLLGKALGGGVMPLAAMVGTDAMMAPGQQQPYLHSQTFSGHPLSCAAGLAALEAMLQLAHDKYAGIEAWLRDLETDLRTFPEVMRDVSRFGAMLSMRFHGAEAAQSFAYAAARAGVLLSSADGDRSVLRVLPPFTIASSQTEEVCRVLRSLAERPEEWTLAATTAAL